MIETLKERLAEFAGLELNENSKFDYWINNVADMPEKIDGVWVDLETGIEFDPSFDYTGGREKTRGNVSAKTKSFRNVAKSFGGRALKGTARQKDWAEKIRSEKLLKMPVDQAKMACDPNGLLNHSKFWIENRNKKGEEIGNFIQEQKRLLELALNLRESGKSKEYKSVASEYNRLTGKWGF